MSETRITKEAARDIWKAACNTKSVLTPFETYERLSDVLQQLSKDAGEDGEPLGQFLVDESKHGEEQDSVECAAEDTLIDLLVMDLLKSLAESGRRRVKAPKQSDRTQWGM